LMSLYEPVPCFTFDKCEGLYSVQITKYDDLSDLFLL